MKKCRVFSSIILLFAIVMTLGTPSRIKAALPGCSGKKIISPEELKTRLLENDLVIVDIRPEEEYGKEHILGAISIPWVVPNSLWITMKDDLLLEIPDTNQVVMELGRLGIHKNSFVVVVNTAEPYSLAGATRVAMTLKYLGMSKVAVLDGGYTKWVDQGYPVTSEVFNKTPMIFKEKIDNDMFVTRDYVFSKLGTSSVIVDARDTKVYSGEVIESYAPKYGHIPSAISLPAPSLWNVDGTYKTKAELQSLVTVAVGCDKHREIILYCGVGGYASTVYWVLTEVLDYKNVKVYDGSAQEWTKYYDMEK